MAREVFTLHSFPNVQFVAIPHGAHFVPGVPLYLQPNAMGAAVPPPPVPATAKAAAVMQNHLTGTE